MSLLLFLRNVIDYSLGREPDGVVVGLQALSAKAYRLRYVLLHGLCLGLRVKVLGNVLRARRRAPDGAFSELSSFVVDFPSSLGSALRQYKLVLCVRKVLSSMIWWGI